MNEELRQKLDELYAMLDDLDCIKNISSLKKNIPSELLDLVNEYRINKTVANKKKLYENALFLEYLKNETELNYLIMQINQRLSERTGQCENN